MAQTRSTATLEAVGREVLPALRDIDQARKDLEKALLTQIEKSKMKAQEAA